MKNDNRLRKIEAHVVPSRPDTDWDVIYEDEDGVRRNTDGSVYSPTGRTVVLINKATLDEQMKPIRRALAQHDMERAGKEEVIDEALTEEPIEEEPPPEPIILDIDQPPKRAHTYPTLNRRNRAGPKDWSVP